MSSLTYNIHDHPRTLASYTHHDLLLHLINVCYQFVQFDSLLYRLVFFLFCLIYLFKDFQLVFVFSLLPYAKYNNTLPTLPIKTSIINIRKLGSSTENLAFSTLFGHCGIFLSLTVSVNCN